MSPFHFQPFHLHLNRLTFPSWLTYSLAKRLKTNEKTPLQSPDDHNPGGQRSESFLCALWLPPSGSCTLVCTHSCVRGIKVHFTCRLPVQSYTVCYNETNSKKQAFQTIKCCLISTVHSSHGVEIWEAIRVITKVDVQKSQTGSSQSVTVSHPWTQ